MTPKFIALQGYPDHYKLDEGRKVEWLKRCDNKNNNNEDNCPNVNSINNDNSSAEEFRQKLKRNVS